MRPGSSSPPLPLDDAAGVADLAIAVSVELKRARLVTSRVEPSAKLRPDHELLRPGGIVQDTRGRGHDRAP